MIPIIKLIRPANGVTALSDICAGIAIAGVTLHLPTIPMLLLLLATFCLYSSGIIFNDVFDRAIDAVERPERPIPAGHVNLKLAIITGIVLMINGILCSFLVHQISGLIALCIGIMTLIYNYFAKHHPLLGPLTMGSCRGLNLLLGTSILGKPTPIICLLPILFVAAITLTSKNEVTGNNRRALSAAVGIDILIACIILYLSIIQIISFWIVIPYLCLWLFMNVKAKVTAIRINKPKNIQQAVKIGVISLIPLNAVYAAGFGGWVAGFIVLSLFPVSLFLARKFAVT